MLNDDAADLVEYLRGRGVLEPAPDEAPRVRALTGGVSGETLLVEAGAARLVVKRALDRLLVEGDWTAKPERAMTEAAGIELAHRLTPDRSPRLLDADADRNIVVMDAAPAGWANWRSVLLGEESDPSGGIVETAGELGAVLRRWQRQTWHDAEVAEQFQDYEAFDQLRVSPFHRAVAQAHPHVADRVHECAEELLARRDCFVHGDYSPKNVLVGGDGLMVLDFEVAHFGAAVFDVAFMQSHLALKALHLPGRAHELALAAASFLHTYADEDARGGGPPRLGSHIACLLLARVDGLSPAPYLTAGSRGLVRDLSLRLLAADDPSPSELWTTILEASR